MRLLDLPPRAAALQVEVETDERERDPDRLGVLGRVLRGERVDDVLVDERRIPVGEGVRRELVVGGPIDPAIDPPRQPPSTGRTTSTVVPAPGSLVRPMRPPCASTRLRAIDRPSPLPLEPGDR